jgi:excisionase family DNA binding protein
MPRPRRARGDIELAALFDEFEGHVVSPAGAAILLGVSRQTVYTLCESGQLRAFRGGRETRLREWIYVPLADVRAYARRTGRSNDAMAKWERWLP